MDKTEFLWKMFDTHTVQGRHHETQRANVTNYTIIVAGGIVAVITNNKGLTHDHSLLAIFLILIGVFGALFTLKQYERCEFHTISARMYRAELEKSYEGLSLLSIREHAKTETKSKFPILYSIRLHHFWICFNVLIAALGFLLLFLTF